MTDRLRLLDLALVVLLGLLGWQMRREWVQLHAREQALRHSTVQPMGVPGLPALPTLAPPTAAEYADVATKNLFSEDRNPNVIVDPPAPVAEKPPPALPVAHGVMLWPGVPPTVVFSEKAGGAQKGYHPGEKVGEWKVLSIDESYVDLEWNGKQFKKRIDELLDRTPIVVEAPQVQAKAQPNTPAPAKTALSSGSSSAPGIDLGGGFKACNSGDSSPAGTVVDGMRKVVSATPFGSVCRWEQVK